MDCALSVRLGSIRGPEGARVIDASRLLSPVRSRKRCRTGLLEALFNSAMSSPNLLRNRDQGAWRRLRVLASIQQSPVSGGGVDRYEDGDTTLRIRYVWMP
jgi:hypothetical protein